MAFNFFNSMKLRKKETILLCISQHIRRASKCVALEPCIMRECLPPNSIVCFVAWFAFCILGGFSWNNYRKLGIWLDTHVICSASIIWCLKSIVGLYSLIFHVNCVCFRLSSIYVALCLLCSSPNVSLPPLLLQSFSPPHLMLTAVIVDHAGFIIQFVHSFVLHFFHPQHYDAMRVHIGIGYS